MNLISKSFFVPLIILAAFLLTSVLVSADTLGGLLPSSDGAYQTWDKSKRKVKNHYSLVDEATCNGNTDYLKTNTVGERESFNIDISSIPDGAIIESIEITPCASQNSKSKKPGSSFIDVFYRLGGVDSADKGSYDVSGFRTPLVLSSTIFTEVGVIKSSSTDLEIGAVYSSGNRGIRLSQIIASVSYSLPPTPTPTPTPDPLIPEAPSNVVITTISCGESVVPKIIQWQDNSLNENGFEIERATDGDIPGEIFESVSTVSADMTFYEDSYIDCGYRVRAINIYGASDWAYVEEIN